jgi:hypothetical protein
LAPTRTFAALSSGDNPRNNGGMDHHMRKTAWFAVALLAGSAQAQDNNNGFTDGPNNTTVHEASGFICPLKIATFERDAAGPRDPERGADYCAYSALSGVYGTIIIMPLPSSFDPKAILSGEFAVQEGTGGRVIDERIQPVGNAATPVYLRTYETTRLESLHYRTLFASAAVGAWAVQVILEYAHPRDKEIQTDFLNAVYSAAQHEIGTTAAK